MDYIYYTLFLQVHSIAAPFASHDKVCTSAVRKPFSWAKPACFDFSSSNFTVQHEMLLAGFQYMGLGHINPFGEGQIV